MATMLLHLKIDIIFYYNDFLYTKNMNALFKKPNLLYLIFVRQCYNLKFWLRPLHRNKLLKAITICKINSHDTIWYISPYDKLIIHMDDGPAIIWADGSQYWYINGKQHRVDGPAIIWADGSQEWYINGKQHRENGPAKILADGTQKWYINDKLHRDDGPALIEADGTQCWFKNGKRHRENGPAYIGAYGTQIWYINGNRHRENGPAYIWPDGTQQWYINGKQVEPFKIKN